MINQEELATRRTVAEEIVRAAGKLALEKFYDRSFKTESKGLQDFVSLVDRETEEFIRERILTAFPDDNVLGEERGGHLTNQTWILDPIDGTSNFVRGTAYWCISLALVVEQKPVIGIVFDPNQDELFSCHLGAGSTLNGEPISVSDTYSEKKAVLGISFNFQKSKDTVGKVVADLINAGTSFRMMGAGALSLAHCAAGRTDGFWEAHMMPWDAAAGLALISEAGGTVCKYNIDNGYEEGNPVIASTPRLAAFFEEKTGVNFSLRENRLGT